jgi:hypothetical protein
VVDIWGSPLRVEVCETRLHASWCIGRSALSVGSAPCTCRAQVPPGGDRGVGADVVRAAQGADDLLTGAAVPYGGLSEVTGGTQSKAPVDEAK